MTNIIMQCSSPGQIMNTANCKASRNVGSRNRKKCSTANKLVTTPNIINNCIVKRRKMNNMLGKERCKPCVTNLCEFGGRNPNNVDKEKDE